MSGQQTVGEKPPAVAHREKRKSFFESIWSDITGAAITIGSGIVSAQYHIKRVFYNNIKIAPDIGGNGNGKHAAPLAGEVKNTVAAGDKLDAVRHGLHELPIIEQSKNRIKEILEEVRKEPDLAAKKRLMRTRLPQAHKTHDQAIATALKEHYGIENVFDKAYLLRPHQNIEVVTKVGATMAVALGAIATVFTLRNVSKDQKDLDRRLDDIEANKSTRSL